jgi:hypothetical protein
MTVYAGYYSISGANYSSADSGGIRISCAQSLVRRADGLDSFRKLSDNAAQGILCFGGAGQDTDTTSFSWAGVRRDRLWFPCGPAEIEGKVMSDVMHSSTVLSAVWEKYSGGRLLLIVNMSNKPAEISLSSSMSLLCRA